MAKKIGVATWRPKGGYNVLQFFVKFVAAACNLVDHKMFMDYEGHRCLDFEHVADLALESFKTWEVSKPAGKKPGKVFPMITKSSAYVSMEFFCPQGSLRFVWNKLVPETAKNHCFIEFVPNRGRYSLLAKVMHVLGTPDELSVNYDGPSVGVGLIPR